MEVLAEKMGRLHDGADVGVVSVRGFVPGPLGSEAGRNGGVGRGGVRRGVWVEGGEAGEVCGGEGGEHSGELGEEGCCGVRGRVAKDGALVGVEAGEDGDAEELAGAEACDGQGGDDAVGGMGGALDGGLEGPADGVLVAGEDDIGGIEDGLKG